MLGFARANPTTSSSTSFPTGGRPIQAHANLQLRATSRCCQRESVRGLTTNTDQQPARQHPTTQPAPSVTNNADTHNLQQTGHRRYPRRHGPTASRPDGIFQPYATWSRPTRSFRGARRSAPRESPSVPGQPAFRRQATPGTSVPLPISSAILHVAESLSETKSPALASSVSSRSALTTSTGPASPSP